MTVIEGLVTVISTAALTFLGAWTAIIYPRAKEKKKSEDEAAKKQEERDEDIDGITSASGAVITPRLVVRVARVETELVKVSDGQSLLEKRMDEANGTGKRTEDKVGQTLEMVRKLLDDRVVVATAGVGLLETQAATKPAKDIWNEDVK